MLCAATRDAGRLGAAALLLAAGSAAAQVAYPELTVSGELLANGIFDPSVEYDAAGTTGWLAYSSVYGDVTPWGPHVETHLARSDDRGATWSFVQVLNPSTVGTLSRPGQEDLEGVWNAEVAINALDPSLADLLVYSEPGAFYRDGVLYLSLTGLSLAGPDRIVLLASDDHGDSWHYVSTPLTNADARALGWESFDGSAIAAEAGRVFLLVSPGTTSLLHDGTLVLEFEDLTAGRLVREGGVPVVRKHVPLQSAFASERGAGQSDFHEHNTAGGLLMPQIKLPDFPRFFQIFETGERLVDAAPVPAAGGVARGLTALGLLWAIRRRARGLGARAARSDRPCYPRPPTPCRIPKPRPRGSASRWSPATRRSARGPGCGSSCTR